MIDLLREYLGPYVLYIKFIHVFAVMAWIWSTSQAYAFYLVPVFKAWRRNPTDQGVIELRNWAMDRFDHGVIYEHIAYPVILITGPLLYVIMGYSMNQNWLLLKLLIVIGVTLPIEIFDYYISHLKGRKLLHKQANGDEAYERCLHIHWWFLLVTSAPIMTAASAIVFLAVAKPF